MKESLAKNFINASAKDALHKRFVTLSVVGGLVGIHADTPTTVQCEHVDTYMRKRGVAFRFADAVVRIEPCIFGAIVGGDVLDAPSFPFRKTT